MSDELASTLASIQEFMAGVNNIGSSTRASLGIPFHMANHHETIPPPTVVVPPPIVTTTDDTRLADTVMRAHRIDDAQLVVLFPMSLSGAAHRCADIDVSRRDLEATRQRSNESISFFVSRWRAKVAGMIDRPKKQGQIDMVLQNLQLSVEGAIARGLWTNTTPFPDSKEKKPVGSSTRSGEFTPLGMTLTRAFEKLRDAGLIVPLAPHPCRILFLLISAYMSIAHIIKFKAMILSVVRSSIIRYRT
ncbi:hypothetical protein CK203_107694 [Vitis vinifera]|uniref:Uncharacterized protein n=1 Tax=Vitis vinifera TaxID=29760 RepID=A0A438CQV9_VITVI|nr:hypothetical protein CK203_107694 [Vitis vinifera]